MKRLAFFLFCLCSGVARAHDADVIYVLVEAHAEHLEETVTLTASSLGQLAPVDADGDSELSQADLDARADSVRVGVWEQMPLSAGGKACVRGDERSTLREGFVELRAQLSCGEGELRQDFRFLSILPTNYRVVLGSQLDGERNRAFAQGTLTALSISRPTPTHLSQERFIERLQDGFARCFTLQAVAAIFLLFFTAKPRPSTVALLVLGMVGGSFLMLPGFASGLTLSLSAIALLSKRQDPRVGLAASPIGLGLGLIGAGGPLLEVGALCLGSTLGLVLISAPSVLIGRILQRRPLALITTQRVLGAAIVVSFLVRLG